MTGARKVQDPWTYTCPECEADIVAGRWAHVRVVCPTCGAGPYDTEHECDVDFGDGDYYCVDRLCPWEE